jgi:putative transposase
MKRPVTRYKRHRFPPQIIQHAVRLYHRFNLSHRDIEDLLARRGVARRALMPETIHSKDRYANNRVELSHQTTRVPERGMRRFKSMLQAQRFLRVHAAVSNLFNLGRHLVAADHYRKLRRSAFASWGGAVAV